MTTLVITRGLPASGKTTWAKEWVAESITTRVRVNRDDLRLMIHDGAYHGHVTERQIMRARDALIGSFLRKGLDVVCDDTNLPSGTVRDLLKLAASAKAEVEIKDLTDVSLTTCIHRDEKRYDGANSRSCVGKSVIMDMHERYIKGKSYPLPVPELASQALLGVEPYVVPEGKPKAILVDIDGTVALMGDRNPYDESRVGQDEPNQPVIDLVQTLVYTGHYPIFMSGRSAFCMGDTLAWLDAHGFSNYELHMRNVSDARKDAVVKLELFNEHVRDFFDVRLVLDDRDQVVELWRSLGLTCLQVAPGDF